MKHAFALARLVSAPTRWAACTARTPRCKRPQNNRDFLRAHTELHGIYDAKCDSLKPSCTTTLGLSPCKSTILCCIISLNVNDRVKLYVCLTVSATCLPECKLALDYNRKLWKRALVPSPRLAFIVWSPQTLKSRLFTWSDIERERKKNYNEFAFAPDSMGPPI